MKSIENFTVLNTWTNEHWFIVTATSTEIFIRAFMVSWRFCDTDNESAGYKESLKPNFPNFPVIRPKAKFFEPRQISYQKAPNLTYISKTIGSSRKYKHPCVTRNCAFSLPDSPEIARIFCKQTRSGIIPNRFLLSNRITLTINILNFPIL